MSAIDHSEDPEPSERFPAGLYVPVRSGPAGCAARFFRTPLGGRTAVGFTSAAKLTAALGANQASIRLSEPALRALAALLGVTALTVDPELSAPLAASVAPAPSLSSALAAEGERERSWQGTRPERIGAGRVTGAAAVTARSHLLIG
ncbi:SAV_915 family protein [Streptomyces sp. NPDC058274]|uniref:SAV_915 family protein n=1 Tax=Streptomyces sp. NPDC058274 TaxID=3346416 RepID=UPI0036E1A24B